VRRTITNHIRSNVIGYIALFLVLTGGTAYALNGSNTVFSKDIVNGQVKRPDIAASAVVSGKVADGSLTGVDIANGPDGADRVNATQVDGHSATCPANTFTESGLCFDDAPRPATSWVLASDDCAARGGMLPTAAELRPTRLLQGVDLGQVSTEAHWTSNIGEDDDGVGLSAVTVQDNGGMPVNNSPTSTNQPYRCAYELVR
jgi:hypothetical protein